MQHLLAASSYIPDTNLVLNILMLGIVLFGAPRFFKATRAQAQLAEKDKAIETHLQYIQSLEQRMEGLADDVKDCQRKAEDAQAEAQVWRGRYEEQAKFTAEPALNEVRDVVAELRVAIVTALTAHGDLVLEEMRQTRTVLDVLARRTQE